ncbi:alpha/beta fold hydrolase [Prauserella cavernicola]|uniref:Alpha/beta fold hydrolase n=1 Tax=Prauserella cavernicola TaxID=2800127 RepID=A0A934V6D6_9PSEU|nr:alpha/beta fold hydrolase [Prauserella cavernicola]MBK1786609.1 alpha/beta fold hydrolase [Prauserella cavernicola]
MFLQGLLARPAVWADVTTALAGRRCITADWPFGAHQQPMRAEAELSPPAIARLVTEVLDSLGVEQAVLVGNDSGGAIAQLVTAAEPGRVTALVLVACDAFEVFPPGAYRQLFRLARVPGVLGLVAAALTVPGLARSRFGFGAVTRDPSQLGYPLADPLIRRDLRKLLIGSSNSQTLEAARTFRDYDRPVLVVWAEEDRLFPRSLGERLAGAFPRGRMVLVPGSRTFVPIDQPQALARLIGEFVEQEAPA